MWPIAYSPYNLFGFIASPIMISTPHCTGIRLVPSCEGADTIIAMWIVIGTWLATTLGGSLLHKNKNLIYINRLWNN